MSSIKLPSSFKETLDLNYAGRSRKMRMGPIVAAQIEHSFARLLWDKEIPGYDIETKTRYMTRSSLAFCVTFIVLRKLPKAEGSTKRGPPKIVPIFLLSQGEFTVPISPQALRNCFPIFKNSAAITFDPYQPESAQVAWHSRMGLGRLQNQRGALCSTYQELADRIKIDWGSCATPTLADTKDWVKSSTKSITDISGELQQWARVCQDYKDTGNFDLFRLSIPLPAVSRITKEEIEILPRTFLNATGPLQPPMLWKEKYSFLLIFDDTYMHNRHSIVFSDTEYHSLLKGEAPTITLDEPGYQNLV
ncbi:hypothetical protein TWF730_008402 [Orbilia blumenaviensis]|uniref:Uncharacterized protein n=1 Tax=Orbilia blumenaviensis TaxID=1796055 RepID=A0AAV9V5F7_9PEZI